MSIPSDYNAGYEKARAVAPDIATNYVAHTLIGDPLGEAMTEDLAELGEAESGRLIRAAMNSEDWDTEAWGAPISAAHLGYAISAFSARLLLHMKTLGADYSDGEYASFMAVWRYSGYLMGIPETILFHDADEALKLYDIGLICEPSFQIESVVMAHSLVNSAPLIAGTVEPGARRSLARYVYRVSRGLIGEETAESLMYPPFSSFGVVWWFKMQQRYGDILGKLLPGRRQDSNFAKFTGLLETSLFDDEGIRYTLPDSVYAEESSKW